MEKVDCVVIGAGVVGLAIARALAQEGREVIVLEAESAFGQHTSSRNSEVIHAGMYYPAGSLKALHCLRGKRLLYQYCRERGIGHRQTGKLIVAVDDSEMPRLVALQEKALVNGVTDLTWMDRRVLAEVEPALQAHAALYSPSTGIVDSHALMLSLLADAEAAGAVLALQSRVTGGQETKDGMLLFVDGTELLAGTVVNAAGLTAHVLAAKMRGVPHETIPRVRYARGVYFTLCGRHPFSHLIYPLPEPGGLGTHLTLDLAGQARFGPDVEWINHIDYHVDPERVDGFYHSIRRWWPQLPQGALSPSYSGIRPKVINEDKPEGDFLIQGQEGHGIRGLINLFGIESPGLTACLSLADEVLRRCRQYW